MVGSGLSPDRGAGEDVAALVDEGPVGGDVDVGRMLPVGVVDELEAAGFQFGESCLGADGAVPAIDHNKVEAGIGETKDGGGIGRQRVVLIGVCLGLGVVEGDESEFDMLESGCGDFFLNLGEPGGIALNADEVGEATGEPEGAAAAAPLEPAHLGSEVLIKPGNGIGREPRVIGVPVLIPPVLEATPEVSGAQEVSESHEIRNLSQDTQVGRIGRRMKAEE